MAGDWESESKIRGGSNGEIAGERWSRGIGGLSRKERATETVGRDRLDN